MSEWIHTAPNPSEPRTLPRIRLFAVLGTWNEEDIVSATVSNAFVQGCERVYVIDNASTDGTVDAARRAGAILARTFVTDRYQEDIRVENMNALAAVISRQEPDRQVWWLYLDADEFHHGPWGMTLRDYLSTLDMKFRVVGMRCFEHYPGDAPHYLPDRHPIDFQPLCEELDLPICPSQHRKHSLIRYDQDAAHVRAGHGFHVVECAEPLIEPMQPAFLHHFPYREEGRTRRRLEALWSRNDAGVSRAFEERDTHMLARFRSTQAVYTQQWGEVLNFVALDPMYEQMKVPPPATGIVLRPWSDVAGEHRHILRWYPMVDAWNYGQFHKFDYGADTTYRRGMAFLDGRGTIEDWGCGFAHARNFVEKSRYVGIDGSSPYADRIADLETYASSTDCIFMRHVLEHNHGWRTILRNALESFRDRLVLIVFTPFGETTRVIATTIGMTSIPVPDISFRKSDLTDLFADLRFQEEQLRTDTQYGTEHIFYLEK
jgi:hypothetical protein